MQGENNLKYYFKGARHLVNGKKRKCLKWLNVIDRMLLHIEYVKGSPDRDENEKFEK